MSAPRAATGLPGVLTFALRPLPTAPLEFVLQRLADSILTRHPGLLERAGSGDVRRFGIKPLDLPFAVVIETNNGRARLRVVSRLDGQRVDARITGNFLALLDLINGHHDGDALFFSRDLAVEGDIGAVLALRNAIDNAELDLLHEAAALTEPWSGVAEPLIRTAVRTLANVAALSSTLGERVR